MTKTGIIVDSLGAIAAVMVAIVWKNYLGQDVYLAVIVVFALLIWHVACRHFFPIRGEKYNHINERKEVNK